MTLLRPHSGPSIIGCGLQLVDANRTASSTCDADKAACTAHLDAKFRTQNSVLSWIDSRSGRLPS